MRFNLLPGVGSRRLRRGIVAAAALTLVTGTVVVAANQANAATGCRVTYTVNQWPGGFTGNITLTNLGDALTSWNLTFTFPDAGQKLTQAWNGKFTQSGSNVTLSNEAWNGNLGTNASVNPGFNGSWTSANPTPTSFSLNGTVCNGGTSSSSSSSSRSSSSSSRSSSSSSRSSSSSSRSSSSSSRSSSSSGGGTREAHQDNPYGSSGSNAKGYVNQEWKARAESVSGGSRVSNTPTGVWMDSIAAVTAPEGSGYTTSLRGHLDAALAQGAKYIQVVIYDLPGRDCAALASNGELGPTEIDRYKTEYIDQIAAIEGDIKYGQIRIVNIVEIDSLPNLVTNAGGTAGSTDMCATMKANGNYVKGIQYALGTLHALGSNIYNYIDAAHHGWIGWSSNFGPSADLFASTAQGAVGGYATVDGFITDTANYSPTVEPYLKVTDSYNGTSVRQSKWVDWNDYVDEQSFAQAFRTALVGKGFSNNIGMLIDTSRNGWGGSARPTGVPTSATSVDDYVNKARIDRRIHAGNWCNQSGAGMGERPKAAPATGIDAYVWIKPPGESDGSSSLVPTGPDNPGGKGFDQMCDPNYAGNGRNGNSMSGALGNAPVSGAWFAAQFQQLMQNAYPPLS